MSTEPSLSCPPSWPKPSDPCTCYDRQLKEHTGCKFAPPPPPGTGPTDAELEMQAAKFVNAAARAQAGERHPLEDDYQVRRALAVKRLTGWDCSWWIATVDGYSQKYHYKRRFLDQCRPAGGPGPSAVNLTGIMRGALLQLKASAHDGSQRVLEIWFQVLEIDDRWLTVRRISTADAESTAARLFGRRQ